MILTLVLACQSPGPLPEAPAHEPTLLWRLGGRLTTQGTTDAPPFAGGEVLLSSCAGALPCAAELWRTEDGDEAIGLLSGTTFQWGEHHWPASWKRLGTELSFCLDTPLSSPPAADRAAFRLLAATSPPHSDPDAEWMLYFSGTNVCELSGELILAAQRDRVDSRGLLSGGLPWSEGGREHALEILQVLHTPVE